MQVGETFIKVRPDTSQFGPQLQADVEGGAQRATTSLNSILGGLAVGALINQGREAASQLEQSIGGTEAVFQENAAVVSGWAENSVNSVGLSERAYRELANVIGGQLKGTGLSLDQVTNSTRDLVQIGADLAATFGGTTEEAVSALGATLRGEFDPAERFGLSLTAMKVQAKAVELGLADATGAVSSQAKATATLALIQEQTADAQGQFAREADTEAGARARASAEAENQAAAFSDQLLPAYSAVMGVASQLAGVFGSLPGPIQTGAIALAALVAIKAPVTNAFHAIGDSATTMLSRYRDAGGGARGLAAAISPGTLGVAAAVGGLALITTELSKQAEGASQARNNVQELADAYTEGGNRAAAESLLGQIRDQAPEALDALEQVGITVRELVDAIVAGEDRPDLMARLQEALNSLPLDQATRLQSLLDSMRSSLTATAEAEEQVAGATEGTNATLQDQVESVTAVADAADAARDNLDALFGVQKGLDDANIGLQETADALTASLRENGRTFDITTEKGRANMAAARESATAIREQTIAFAASSGSARRAGASNQFLTGSLRNQLIAAGLSRAETDRLIATYGRVPRNVLTSIALQGAGAVIGDLQRIHAEANAAAAAVGQISGSLAGGGSYSGGGGGGGGAEMGVAPEMAMSGPTVVVQATTLGTPESFAREVMPTVVREMDRMERRGR